MIETKIVDEDCGSGYTMSWHLTLRPNGEFSTFIVRDPNGHEVERRTCGALEAKRLFDDWEPEQVSKLDLEDGA